MNVLELEAWFLNSDEGYWEAIRDTLTKKQAIAFAHKLVSHAGLDYDYDELVFVVEKIRSS